MVEFKPIKKKPGDLIRSEDWNKIQEDILKEFEKMENEIAELKNILSRFVESIVLVNLESPFGESYPLDQNIPGETSNYGISVLGHITRQWVLPGGKTGLICRFAIMDFFDILYYWSGARNGDREVLEISLEYIDGSTHTISNIYLHEFTSLRPKGTANPYVEYLLSPTEHVWYKYLLRNPYPSKQVKYIFFKNINPQSTPRIGNTLHYLSKLKMI